MTQRYGNNTVGRGPQPTPQAAPPPLSRAFIVGRMERGPVGVPTQIRDYEEFRAVFGAGSDASGTTEIALVASDYFRTVGNVADALVLRLFEGDAAAATAKETAAVGAAKVTAQASGPGKFGNNLQRAFVLGGTVQAPTLTVYAREFVNGVALSSRISTAVPVTDAGIAEANAYMAGLIVLNFDPAGAAAALNTTTPGQPLNWVNLAGGVDSAAITTATLQGTVNADTQVRTGLEMLKDSKYGGGALVAPGFETDAGRAVKFAWAAATLRFVPECPGSDMLISGGIADYQACRLIPSAEYSGYWFGRARSKIGGRYVTHSAVGGLAGLCVSSVMARNGYVAPPAGDTVFTDIQRSPDGSAPLVSDANMAGLTAQGLNVLVSRQRVQAQGLALTIADPLQPATTKVHHRLLSNALAYDLGPALQEFDNKYVDAQGAFYTTVEGMLKSRIKPYHDSGVLYGLSLADAVDVQFAFQQSPAEAVERAGRVAVNILYKVSGVSEGIDLSLGQVTINTAF